MSKKQEVIRGVVVLAATFMVVLANVVGCDNTTNNIIGCVGAPSPNDVDHCDHHDHHHQRDGGGRGGVLGLGLGLINLVRRVSMNCATPSPRIAQVYVGASHSDCFLGYHWKTLSIPNFNIFPAFLLLVYTYLYT